MRRILWWLDQVQYILEDHEVGLAPRGRHQVGLGQPLLVRLITGIFEQLWMFDIQAAACLSESQGLNRTLYTSFASGWYSMNTMRLLCWFLTDVFRRMKNILNKFIQKFSMSSNLIWIIQCFFIFPLSLFRRRFRPAALNPKMGISPQNELMSWPCWPWSRVWRACRWRGGPAATWRPPGGQGGPPCSPG